LLPEVTVKAPRLAVEASIGERGDDQWESTEMYKTTLAVMLAALMLSGVAAPASAAKSPNKPRPSIVILDEVSEGGWARYPVDLTWGQPAHARYYGSEVARITCRNEVGDVIWRGPRQHLTGEGGPGVSIDIPVLIPYVAATYSFCRADLLGRKGRIIASDRFIVYSPV
jgi:hypothetical protein